jgi:PTH1 family peptidyl-tRNA hydrolase
VSEDWLKLIVGLGNPGPKYHQSRHNLGFLVLDELSSRHDISMKKTLFQALTGEGKIEQYRVLLAKPQTYMNLSGQAVRKLVDFRRIPLDDLFVVHDDLDLPLGTVRLKTSGGDGGHRGLSSVIEHLGTTTFKRVRLGIGRPPCKEMTESYVLSLFDQEEKEPAAAAVTMGAQAVEEAILVGLEKTMGKFHSR